MSCNCFAQTPHLTGYSFKELLELCKCKCTSRYCVSENKRSFCIDSRVKISQIDKVKIDGYLISSLDCKKCDYLFIFKEDKFKESSYIFIELKGGMIKTAIEQLLNTINVFYNNALLYNKRVRAVVVFSTYPRDNGEYRKAVLKLMKEFKNKLSDFKVIQQSKRLVYNPLTDSYV